MAKTQYAVHRISDDVTWISVNGLYIVHPQYVEWFKASHVGEELELVEEPA